MRIRQGSTDITRQMINKGVQDIVASTPSGDTYYLNPSSAGIIEGVVTDTIALANTNVMNVEIQAAKTSGYTVFELPTMDAYFDTAGDGSKFTMHDGAIKVPNNMHFKMTAGTVIRRQPNNYNRSHLISACYIDANQYGTEGMTPDIAENIEISGGTLVGELNDHTYTQYYTVSNAATTATAEIKIQREHVSTVYSITVTPNDAITQASEIASYLNGIADLYATSEGAIITLYGNAGVYVLMDDDATDTSNINFTGYQDISYGYGISLYGVHNGYIHDTYIKDFHGDGLFLGITSLRNSDGTLVSGTRTCENVLIKRVTTENNRRQGISVVDCNGYETVNVALPTPGGLGDGSRYGVMIEDCDITDTGRDIWTGPSYGIDLESTRYRDENDNLLEFARVEGVVVKNCRFTGNRKGDLNLYTSQFTEIFGNTFDYKIGCVAANNSSIHDNLFTGLGATPESAISITSFISALGNELVSDFEIYNNTINAGYSNAFVFSGNNFEVYNNTIVSPGNRGILVSDKLTNSYFHDNNISSTSGGTGISNLSSGTLTNVLFENETINMGGVGLGGGVGMRFDNITGAGVTDVNGIVVRTCNINGDYPYDIIVNNSSNITFENCTYDEPETDSGNTNVLFIDGASKTAIALGDIYPTGVPFDYKHENRLLTAAQINSRNPDLLLYNGDIYADGLPDQYAHTLAPYQTLIDEQKFYTSLGDHELNMQTSMTSSWIVNEIGSVVIPRNASWKYLELPNGDSFPTDWKEVSFNDTAWSSGLGGFGKGTVSGVTLNTTFATTVQNYLLRKDIESSSIASTGLVIETSILGGAEIYINGVLCYSYNMFYPVTETSTALDDAAVVPTIYTEGYQQVIRIPKDYFNLVGTNQIAVLLKNTTIAYSKMHFEMQLHDYTFPSVGVFGNQTFQSTGFGDGVWTMIPYLPKNAEQYSIIQDNVEYFIITSGQKDGTSSVSTPSGQGINSQSADWLKGALAISMANTDIDLRCLMIHQGPVSWVQGSKNKPFHNYIFEDSYFNTKIDFLLVGDSHVSEAFEHSPSEIKVFNASNHKGNSTDIPTSYKQANIYDQTGDTNMGSSTSGTWSTLFYDQTPLNNLFIEITTNPSGVVTLEYIDKDGVVNHTEQLFPKP